MITVSKCSQLPNWLEYTIEIETLRKATESDARVLKAVGYQQEAIRLRSKPGTRKDAIQVYERVA